MTARPNFFKQLVRNPWHAFRDMSLRPKLIIISVGVAIFIGLLALIGAGQYTAILTKQVGEELVVVAETQGQNFGTVLAQHVESMQAFVADPELQAAVAAQNATYTGSQEQIESELGALDEQWATAGDDEALVSQRLTGDLAQELENVAVIGDFSEVFATDRYGGLVAASQRTSDYYQADEGWWQAAYNDGQGGVFIDEPEVDESTGVIGIDMAVPIYAAGSEEIIGVLRTTLDATTLFAEFQIALGETGEVDIAFPSGMIMGGGDEAAAAGGIIEEQVDPALLEQLNAASNGYVDAAYEGAPSFVARGPVVSVGNEDFIADLNWKIITHQAKSEALQAVNRVNQGATILVIVFAVICGLTAMVVGRAFTNPILKLTDAVKRFAAGDRSIRTEATSADEIGTLSSSFNTMAEEVDTLMADIQARSEELAERTRELEASQRVTFAASERATPEELLGLVVELIRDQFDLYHAQVYLVDEEQDAAVLRQSTGYAGRQLLQRKHSIPLDATALVTQAIHTGEPVLVDDTSKDPNFMANPLLPETRSELVVPLKLQDDVIGVLDTQDRTPGRFGPSTVNLFQSMSDQVAMLFENAELLERITEQTESMTIFTTQLRTAAEIARRLGTILDPERLARESVELLQSRFGLYHAHIYLLDQETRQLTMHVGSGEVGRVLRERGHTIDLDAEQSLVARAAREQRTVTVADTSLESDFLPNPLLPETRSEVAVPLIVGDRVLGVLDVQDNQPNRFSQADVDTFGTLAGQIATSMQTADLFEQTQIRLRVSRALADAQTEDQVLDVLIQQASLDPQAQVALMLVDPQADELTMEVVRTESSASGLPPVPEGTRFTKENMPALDYLTPTEDFIVDDVTADERMDPQSQEFMEQMGIRSGANIPLTLGDAWLGELVINAKQESFFDKQKLTLYHTLADQGATALQVARLNEATAESERQYSELLNGLRDGFAVVNLDGYVTDCNAAFEQIVGYSLDELKDIKFSELTVEEYREMEAQILEEQALTRGYTDLYEKEYYRKDGSTVPVELTVYMVEDKEGNPAGFWGFIRDITERKRAEEAIQESEERFRDVALSTSDWVWETDAQGHYTYCSNKVLDVLGYTAEEMLGKTPFDAMPEEEAARVGEIFGQIVANKAPIVDLENRNLTKDGREVYLLTSGTPILDDDGNLVGYRGVDKDITASKQAEAEREEQRALLDSILSSLPVGVWVADQQFNVLLTNEYQQNMMGREIMAEGGEAIVERYDVVNFETGELYDEGKLPIVQTMTDGQPHVADDMGIRWPDGKVVPVMTTTGPLVGAGGEQVGTVAITQDITERKQVELERQRFTTQLRTAADLTEQVNAILDPDQLLPEVVDQLQSRFDLYHVHIYMLDEPTAEEIMAADDKDVSQMMLRRQLVMHAGSGEVGQELLERGHSIALNTEKSLVARAARDRSTILVNDTGKEPDFMPNPLLPETKAEIAVPLIAGENVLGVLDVQDNQAERFTQSDVNVLATLAGQIATALQNASYVEQVEARLKVSQALAGAQTEDEVLEAMVSVADFYPEAQIALFTFDPETKEPTAVYRAGDTFESGLDSVVEPGMSFPAAQFPLMNLITAEQPFVASNALEDERFDPASRMIVEQTGVASLSILPITTPGGEWLGFLTASAAQEGYFDQRKQYLYQALADQGATALRIARLYDETQRTAEQLREVDRLKSEFLASMSHELRTPLNSIIGYTEIMLMGIDSELDPEMQEDVQAIYDNGQHLLRIINDVLDLAKIEAGRLELNMEEVPIETLVDAASSSATGLLLNKPVELNVDIEDDLPLIRGDQVRLNQILNNLVSNAIKFTDEGHINLRAFKDDGWVCIEVEDTGIGIREEDMPRLFERFQQVDGSNARQAEGTGLGLAITRHLTQMHGGDIQVNSTYGEGSTFTVQLPVAPTESESDADVEDDEQA